MRLMRPPLLDWLESKVVVVEEEGGPWGQAWRAGKKHFWSLLYHKIGYVTYLLLMLLVRFLTR